MFRAAVVFACLAMCRGTAVLPIAPIHHAAVGTSGHLGIGYAGLAGAGFTGHGLIGTGLYGHGLAGAPLTGYGLVGAGYTGATGLADAGLGAYGPGLAGHGYAKPLGHHILKRSPHLVSPIAHVAPVAVSHQSRVDVRSSPALIHAAVLPIVKPVVAPVLHAAPLLHKSFIAAPLSYGAGHYGGY